jgi:GGDEF domain-containing protein
VYASGEPVCADLSAARERWPRYTPEADRLRVCSFAALPLRAHGRTWGVLDLYGASSEPLTEEEMAAACTLSDTAAAYVTAAHDRHARRLAEDELRLQALHDPLTGLPNRLLMLDRLKHALTGVARQPGSVGLLFLDLDGFKQVNDAHGHIAGDQLLVAVAERLTQTLRPTDTLARLGGDEFVVLCEDLHRGGGDLKAIAERVLAGWLPLLRCRSRPC